MPILPNADWLPDAPAYQSTSATVAKGCYPAADGSDRPLQGGVSQGVALDDKAVGGITVLDKSGTAYTFAATATDIFLANAGFTVWTNKTRSADGTYDTPPDRHWKFAQFGEQVLGVNGETAEKVQAVTLPAASRFDDLDAGAPQARYIAAFEPGFVMVGYFSNAALGTLGGGVGWSGINDATVWPTWGTTAAAAVQSDYNILPGGGNVTALVPSVGGAAGLVLCERSVYRVEYAGPPQILAFRQIDVSRGCICPQGVAVVGTVAFFISEDGFMRCDGTNVVPIGAGRVDRTFQLDVGTSQLERVYATVDFSKKCVIWAYPNNSAVSGNPNRWIIYSYAVDRWRFCDDPGILLEFLNPPMRSPGYTLDQMDLVFPDGIDGSGAFAVDDPTYQGGTRILAGFDINHTMVYFNGANLAATMETGEMDAPDAHRVFVSGLRPVTDAAQVATASVGYRNQLADGVQYTAATTPGPDRVCPQRISTPYARGRVQIPAGANWSYFRGVEAYVRPDGRR